jgi:hypothetical protein
MARTVLPFVALLTVSLSACAGPPAGVRTGGPNPPLPDRCNADQARALVGKRASDEVVEQARVAAGAELVRVLKPGQMVTMEFREGRLNLLVDGGNVITDVRCG